ncbi:MAG: exodeoxyribonuclease VII large subunit [Epulopiscium sp.]|jgi:exodeoxyribonuclease VII large subunit|nr:exodeoxyribonuclease VII large subunit [Candidatus Epulonipiscium sp.]
MNFEPKVFSVGQINRYIKNTLENDVVLNSVWIKGEISNFKAHSSGHFYFTLKDEVASMPCVMFRDYAELLPFVPENGIMVVIWGYISVYEKTGQYQLYAELMQPMGIGSLQLAFEQMKQNLAAEGLFDTDYKRDICKTPQCIAVITSPTGAAVRDIIQIIKRRNATVKIVVVPALVQGEKAAQSIVAALQTVNEWGKADTIILGRGGGSMEDLWAFNEEAVARAIFASEIPVISAVGHETDFTIADFVADLRAPTPSAAAELAVNQLEDGILQAKNYMDRIQNEVEYLLGRNKERLQQLLSRPVLKRPAEKIKLHSMYLESLKKRLDRQVLEEMRQRLRHYEEYRSRLEASSPLSILKRGYSVVYDTKGKPIRSVGNVEKDDILMIQMPDGRLKTMVMEKENADYGKEKT